MKTNEEHFELKEGGSCETVSGLECDWAEEATEREVDGGKCDSLRKLAVKGKA